MSELDALLEKVAPGYVPEERGDKRGIELALQGLEFAAEELLREARRLQDIFGHAVPLAISPRLSAKTVALYIIALRDEMATDWDKK